MGGNGAQLCVSNKTKKNKMIDEYDEDYAFNKALEAYPDIPRARNEADRFMDSEETQILTLDRAKSLVGKTIRWTHPTADENEPELFIGKILAIKEDERYGFRIVMEQDNGDNPPFPCRPGKFQHDWIFLNYEDIFCCSGDDRYVHFQIID